MYHQIINCAVVGLGVGEQHALALLKDPRVNLICLVDHDQFKIQKFIINNNLNNVTAKSFKDVLLDQQVDFVSIASFDNDHYEQIMDCLKNNKHIFVEKPLCQNRKQLNNIFLQWKTTKLLGLSSNLVLRKAPLYLWLRQAIKEGMLGEIYAFHGDYLYGRVHKITEEWRKDVDNYSVMQGGGIHIIDLMLWLTGQKPISVQSWANKIVTKNTAFRYHDFHAATFFFESGMIGEITANFGCVHKHQHVIKIFGTKATFIYDDMGARIYWDRKENRLPEKLKYAPQPEHKGVLITDFIDNILSKNIIYNARIEFDLMSIVLSADESLNYKNLLHIEYLTC